MSGKTSNLYVRIEPETKLQAESILDALGIPVSTAINMFYRQIILNQGLPFMVKVPEKMPLNINEMTESQFNYALEESWQDMQDGKGLSVAETFDSIKRKR